MDISVVLPTYNERENISIMIPRIEELLSSRKHEIVIVDDSSPDGTASVARDLNRKYGNIRVIERPGKLGIGSAIRDGYDQARGDIIVSMDSDMQFRPRYILDLITKIEAGSDMVVGSRYNKLGNYEKPTIYVHIKSKVSEYGNQLLRLSTGIPIRDFSVNCRAIRRDVWQGIETREISNFFLFETIFKVHRAGYRVSDIPIKFRKRQHGQTKLSLRKEIPSFLFKLSRYALSGK